ncbi:MAG: hypothetical protein GX258_06465 [Clostridiales bacterium]|nr:hypothetical protein [Clostridiales bacterium]
MYIENYLSGNVIKEENKEMRYYYRLIKEDFMNGHAYGIEAERQDFIEDKLVKIEREEIRKISNIKEKVEKLMYLLNDNLVSPIHMVDILGSYVDKYVSDFN